MRRKQRLNEATQLYEQALNALETQSVRLGGDPEAHSSFRAKYSGAYTNYIDLLLVQGKTEQAFKVLERARARTLLEMLTQAGIDIHKGIDASLLEQEHTLQRSLSSKSALHTELLNGVHTAEQVASLDKQLQELLDQYLDTETQIRTHSPAYAALTQPQPLSANEVQQQLLDTKTLLVEYSLGEERSYVFAVTPDSLDAYELPKRSAIEDAARHVYELLITRKLTVKGEEATERHARLASAEKEYSQTVAELSRMVLGPVTAKLQGKRLLIVSDGALEYIPFSVLPVPSSANSPHSVPLVAEHEIVNLPSASVLAVLRKEEVNRTQPSKAVAVLADPVFAAGDDRLLPANRAGQAVHDSVNKTASSSENTDSDLLPDGPSDLDRSARDVGVSGDRMFLRLPFTRREAQAIQAIAQPGDVTEHLDFDASKTTALGPQLKDYRIVHFATHGLLNNDHPELSGLVFSLVDRQGKPQDGFLRMLDIYNMELNADLVVLSACQTALGKQIGEEGLTGLTRGFMYAGAPRVVASLWKVDDEATAALMKKFYEGMLREHQTPAHALRAAQQWMRTQKQWQSPYYWAGFILQGEWK
jgi:CHAT domain-containing protein